MEPTVIYRVRPDKGIIIAILLQLGLWDAMTIAERKRLCETGEVLNTHAGASV